MKRGLISFALMCALSQAAFAEPMTLKVREATGALAALDYLANGQPRIAKVKDPHDASKVIDQIVYEPFTFKGDAQVAIVQNASRLRSVLAPKISERNDVRERLCPRGEVDAKKRCEENRQAIEDAEKKMDDSEVSWDAAVIRREWLELDKNPGAAPALEPLGQMTPWAK